MRILFYPWFGSKIKHYTKYIENYKTIFGSDTVVDVVPYKISDAISYSSWKKIRSGKILDDVNSEYDLVHMISGGCLVGYNQLKFYKEYTPKKVIFDSGPFYPCSYLTSNFIYRKVKILPKSSVPTLKYGFDKLWKIQGGINLNEEYLEWLHTRNNSLCLINSDDKLIDLDRIDEYIKKTNSKKIEINSTHAFLIKDIEKYNESIITYMNE